MGITHLQAALKRLGITVHRSKHKADVIAVDLLHLLFKLRGTTKSATDPTQEEPVILPSGNRFMTEIKNLININCKPIANPGAIVIVTMDTYGRFPMKDETRQQRAVSSQKADERKADKGERVVERHTKEEMDLLVNHAHDLSYFETGLAGIDLSKIVRHKEWGFVRRLLKQLAPTDFFSRDTMQCVYVVDNNIITPINANLPQHVLPVLQNLQESGVLQMPEADTHVVDIVMQLAVQTQSPTVFAIVSSDQDLVPISLSALWQQRHLIDFANKRFFLFGNNVKGQFWESLLHKCDDKCEKAPSQTDLQIGVDLNDLYNEIHTCGMFGPVAERVFTAMCILCHTDYFKAKGKGAVQIVDSIDALVNAFTEEDSVEVFDGGSADAAFIASTFFKDPGSRSKFLFNYRYWRTRRLLPAEWRYIGDKQEMPSPEEKEEADIEQGQFDTPAKKTPTLPSTPPSLLRASWPKPRLPPTPSSLSDTIAVAPQLPETPKTPVYTQHKPGKKHDLQPIDLLPDAQEGKRKKHQ